MPLLIRMRQGWQWDLEYQVVFESNGTYSSRQESEAQTTPNNLKIFPYCLTNTFNVPAIVADMGRNVPEEGRLKTFLPNFMNNQKNVNFSPWLLCYHEQKNYYLFSATCWQFKLEIYSKCGFLVLVSCLFLNETRFLLTKKWIGRINKQMSK